MKLTRRDFIKTAGAATGTMAISSMIPMPVWAEGQNGRAILTVACWGVVHVEVKDGRVISSKGALPKTVPNSLQQTVSDQVYTNIRVKYSMVCKSYLENPGKADGKRGNDPFVRASWEQVSKLINEQHSQVCSSYGPASVFASSYGWRSNGVLHKT